MSRGCSEPPAVRVSSQSPYEEDWERDFDSAAGPSPRGPGPPSFKGHWGCEVAPVWGWMGVETLRPYLPSGDRPRSSCLRGRGSTGLGHGHLPRTVLGAAEGGTGVAQGGQDRNRAHPADGGGRSPLLDRTRMQTQDRRRARPEEVAQMSSPSPGGSLEGGLGQRGATSQPLGTGGGGNYTPSSPHLAWPFQRS